MSDDYGYFGTGITGYAHYNQTFQQCFGGDGGYLNGATDSDPVSPPFFDDPVPEESEESFEEEASEPWRARYMEAYLSGMIAEDPEDYDSETAYLAAVEQETAPGEPCGHGHAADARETLRESDRMAKNEQKRKILQKSFDILKNDFQSNSAELINAVRQVMAFDPRLAAEMWHELVEIHQPLLLADKSTYGAAYDLTGGMLCELHDHEAFAAMEPLLAADAFLVENLFGKTPAINYSHHRVIGNLIKTGQLQNANRMLALLYDNKRAQESMGFTEVLQELIEEELLVDWAYGSCFISTHDSVQYNGEVRQLIHGWIDRVQNPIDRAKLDISYIKIC